MKKKGVIVSLGGGLGNQLFQLAAGLNFAGPTGSVDLEWTRQMPRLNKTRKPEISSFILPPGVVLQMRRLKSPILKKALGYQRRMRISPRGVERFRIYRTLIHIAANAISLLHLQWQGKVFHAQGLGYFDGRPEWNRCTIVGYFQSYIWASEGVVKDKLVKLAPIQKSDFLSDLEQHSLRENPIVIHVRLGDYKQETTFGVLSPEYYHHALSEVSKHTTSRNVWVFSDEIDSAKKYFEELKQFNYRFIDVVDNSTSQTFEAMRFGSNYVIGNSTFSWWAAFLSKTPNAYVVAPKPWFQGMDEPKDLIPPTWDRLEARWI